MKKDKEWKEIITALYMGLIIGSIIGVGLAFFRIN